jgi:hypothetical protein
VPTSFVILAIPGPLPHMSPAFAGIVRGKMVTWGIKL